MGVSIWPPPCGRVVESVPIIEEAGFLVGVFGGEPDGVVGGHGSCRSDGFPEGAIFVAGGDGGIGRVDQAGDVAIAVIGDEVVGGATGVIGDLQETADASGTLL
jgi:hypothetical protein